MNFRCITSTETFQALFFPSLITLSYSASWVDSNFELIGLNLGKLTGSPIYNKIAFQVPYIMKITEKYIYVTVSSLCFEFFNCLNRIQAKISRYLLSTFSRCLNLFPCIVSVVANLLLLFFHVPSGVLRKYRWCPVNVHFFDNIYIWPFVQN